MIERQSEKMRDRQFDRVGMENAGNDLVWFFMGLDDPFQRGRDARLHFRERLAFGKAKTRRGTLDDLPGFGESERLPRPSLPFADETFDQAGFLDDRQIVYLRDGTGSFHGAFQRARVNGLDRYIFERIGQRLRLFLSAFVQVDAGGVARKFSLFGKVVFAVTDEEKKGHGELRIYFSPASFFAFDLISRQKSFVSVPRFLAI